MSGQSLECRAGGRERQIIVEATEKVQHTKYKVVTQKAVCDCGVLQINHTTHSPDLAPSDYYLFTNLRSHLHGTQFADNEWLKAVVEAWFEGQDRKFFFKI